MYQFGDEFLETVGLSSMPEAQRAGFWVMCETNSKRELAKK